jgi:hypothetical protein
LELFGRNKEESNGSSFDWATLKCHASIRSKLPLPRQPLFHFEVNLFAFKVLIDLLRNNSRPSLKFIVMTAAFRLALIQMKVCENKSLNLKNARDFVLKASDLGANVIALPVCFLID